MRDFSKLLMAAEKAITARAELKAALSAIRFLGRLSRSYVLPAELNRPREVVTGKAVRPQVGYPYAGHEENRAPAGWKVIHASETKNITIFSQHYPGSRHVYEPDRTVIENVLSQAPPETPALVINETAPARLAAGKPAVNPVFVHNEKMASFRAAHRLSSRPPLSARP